MQKIRTKFRQIGYYFKRSLDKDRIMFTVAVIFCFVWTWSAISATSRNWELERRLTERRQELSLLELEVDTLELENQYYASEEYQELAARAKQNKIADGETLIYLPKNSDTAKHKHQDVIIETVKPEPSNFRQWVSFLFGVL